MKDFELLFKQTVAEWLEQKLPVESQPIEVLDFQDNIREFGGCETCGPTYDVEVEIHYTEQDGKRRRIYTYGGSLVDLIKELGSIERNVAGGLGVARSGSTSVGPHTR